MKNQKQWDTYAHAQGEREKKRKWFFFKVLAHAVLWAGKSE